MKNYASALVLAVLLSPMALTQANDINDELSEFFDEASALENEVESSEIEDETTFSSSDEPETTEDLAMSESETTEDSGVGDTTDTNEAPEEAEATEDLDTTASTSAESTSATTQTDDLVYTLEDAIEDNKFANRIFGAQEVNGMTVLITSSKRQINRYVRCEINEEEVLANQLGQLKRSQGAQKLCREDIEFRYLPYRSFRK